MRLPLSLACLLWLLVAASIHAGTADQVKFLGQHYNEVEEQLPRSAMYARTTEAAGVKTVQRAWFNGAGEWLKLAIERTDASSRDLTEYVSGGSELADDGLFVLSRHEVRATDGSTQIDEARRYYGQATIKGSGRNESIDNGILIRELKKTAHFAPGEVLDTVKAKNVVLEYPATTQFANTEEGRTEKQKFFAAPRSLAEQVRKTGKLEVDPTAGAVGDSERYRLIRGTVSPDGRWASAIGFAKATDWQSFRDTFFENEEIYTAEDAEGLKNYVIDLATRRILGEIGSSYFGTKERYNHREFSVVWAPDSSTFVAGFDDKWNYVSLHAGRILPGGKWGGAISLGTMVEKQAVTIPQARRYKEEASIALSVEEVKNHGTVLLEVTGQGNSGEHKGDVFFTVKETLRLQGTPGGLRAKFLSTTLSREK